MPLDKEIERKRTEKSFMVPKKDIVDNQYHDFDKFLEDTELVVILVGHDEIKENMDKLKNKIVLDTRKICDFEDVYRL